MHPALLAVMQETGLNAAAKSLAALVYAHTNGTGYAELPLDQVVTALGVGEHKLRSYRAALHRLGYMQSSVSAGCLIVDVNLSYSAPPERVEVTDRAEAARSDVRSEPDSAPTGRAADTERAEAARCEPKSAPRRRALPPTPPVESEEELINLTGDTKTPPPLPPHEPGLTFALLTDRDLGVSFPVARRLAAAYPFRHCLAHAISFRAERKDHPRHTAGLLVHRISQAPAPALPTGWETLPVDFLDDFARRARALIAQLEPRRAPSAPAPEPEPDPEPEPVAPAADQPDQTVWGEARSQLRLQLPRSTYETWVRDTTLLARTDDAFTVGVANTYARDWLTLRLQPLIVRTLKDIVGCPVTIAFSAPEAL